MNIKKLKKQYPLLLITVLMLSACSTTSGLRDDQQLYTGMLKTQYDNYTKNSHFYNVQEELDLVLASKPNGSLLGSPSIRSPFPIGLWIWNAFANDTTRFSRWITKTFGSTPVTLSTVTPELRVKVGENLLNKRGYFDGKITYDAIQQSNKKKVKLRYNVSMGRLWTIDSISYTNFPAQMSKLIAASRQQSEIKKGSPFDVAALEKERQRITLLFKDNGYYYYQNNNASYLADTAEVSGRANIRLQLADSVSSKALRQWHIGDVTINLRHDYQEPLAKHKHYGSLTINYNGKRPQLHPRLLCSEVEDMKNEIYNYEKMQRYRQKLSSTGIFQTAAFTFSPKDATDTCKVLNLNVDAVFDKPYSFFVEAYGKGKTNQRYGPELVVGLTKRNAFRAGELLNVNVHGSYAWSTARSNSNATFSLDNYEYGLETSIQYPRILTPTFITFAKKRGKRAFFSTPSTTVKASFAVINRAGYFRRHVASADFTYQWQPTEQSMFTFSPLTLTYEYMNATTKAYTSMTDDLPYLKISMADQFIPKMQFQYTYMSSSSYANPIKWWTTVSEASNILSLGYMAAGKRWQQSNKKMFKNPYAQFLKVETNFTKTWQLSKLSSLAAHLNAGIIWVYGNSEAAPYTEQFYIGGANSIRAFNVREIGPGRYRSKSVASSYVEQTGDVKLQANIEYRPHLFRELYGAIFLDAGNVWTLHNEAERPLGQLLFPNMLTQIGVGTGVGLRYDIGYFMIRLDWGVGLHVPYPTGKAGFYNISSFRDAQALHLAIGLPF